MPQSASWSPLHCSCPGEDRGEGGRLGGWLALPRVSWPVSQRGAVSVAPSSPPRRSRSLRTMLEPFAERRSDVALWVRCSSSTLGASARFWLSELQRKSEHSKGMPTSHCVQSRRQISASIGAWKAKGLETEGGGRSSPSPLPPARLSLAACFNDSINSWSRERSPQGRACCSSAIAPAPWVFAQRFSQRTWDLL